MKRRAQKREPTEETRRSARVPGWLGWLGIMVLVVIPIVIVDFGIEEVGLVFDSERFFERFRVFPHDVGAGYRIVDRRAY